MQGYHAHSHLSIYASKTQYRKLTSWHLMILNDTGMGSNTESELLTLTPDTISQELWSQHWLFTVTISDQGKAEPNGVTVWICASPVQAWEKRPACEFLIRSKASETVWCKAAIVLWQKKGRAGEHGVGEGGACLYGAGWGCLYMRGRGGNQAGLGDWFYHHAAQCIMKGRLKEGPPHPQCISLSHSFPHPVPPPLTDWEEATSVENAHLPGQALPDMHCSPLGLLPWQLRENLACGKKYIRGRGFVASVRRWSLCYHCLQVKGAAVCHSMLIVCGHWGIVDQRNVVWANE